MDFRKKTIRDVEVAGKNVLVRVDYNVPMDGSKITNDARIVASLPTVKYLLENGARKVILISHLGRPDGEYKPELSLRPCMERLAELLPGTEVRFSEMIYGPATKDSVEALPEGGVILLENLRYVPDEEENSAEFAKQIVESTGAELFVQDGFAVIHRGFLVEKEVSNLEAAIVKPERPLLVIVGGAKVDDKQPLIDKFLPIADEIAVGGKIAADGYKNADKKVYVAEDFATDADGLRLDIGPKSVRKIENMIAEAKTIVWNGTMGKVEDEEFATGSLAVARMMGASKATTIIGGGDTVGFVEGLLEKEKGLEFNLLSTGGGASLELLSGKKLPGLEILQDK